MTALYELEIALSQIASPNTGAYTLPWLVDRLLRNLLIDVSGNTHRTEICIDKLYSPDGPTGTFGSCRIPWLRDAAGARACRLAQQLLVRAHHRAHVGVTYLGTSACAGARRCTTGSCCRITCGRTSLMCCVTCAHTGSTCGRNGSRRRQEFRFPFCGEIDVEGVNLEIRQALEPWHVLGETGAIGARCVMTAPPSACR